MKVRSQLNLITLGILVSFLIMLLSFAWYSKQLIDTLDREDYISAILDKTSTLNSQLLYSINKNLILSNDDWIQLQSDIQLYLNQPNQLTPQLKAKLELIKKKNITLDNLYQQYSKLITTPSEQQINMVSHLLDKMYIEVVGIKELSFEMIKISESQIKQALYYQNIGFLLISLIAVSFLIITSNRVFNKIHHALTRLKNGLSKTGQSDFSTQIENFSDDEFREVADHFNQMIQNLKQTTILKDELKKQVQQRTHELQQLAETDALTKLPNRRFLNRRIESDIATAKRMQHSLSLLMIDIDFFKNYNDFYGHDMGDIVLSKIAHAISDSLPRITDSVSRFGGEEFVVLLPSTEKDAALSIAERIHLSVKAISIDHEKSDVNPKITISIGIATLNDKNLNDIDLFKQADIALYKAKNNGRNQSQIYTPTE